MSTDNQARLLWDDDDDFNNQHQEDPFNANDDPREWLFTSSPPLSAHAPRADEDGIFDFTPRSRLAHRQLEQEQSDGTNLFGYHPALFFDDEEFRDNNNDDTPANEPNTSRSQPTTQQRQRSPSESDMPASRRNQQPGDVVDLTTSPVAPRRSRKRSAEPSSSDSQQNKRRKDTASSSHKPADEVDQSDMNEAPSVEEKLLQAEQEQAIASQQGNELHRQKIGQRQCIICMENYTNATVTACGHIYCHECLSQALAVGERHGGNGGTCPNCRKRVYRKRPNQVIPVAFMTKGEFDRQARARPAQEA